MTQILLSTRLLYIINMHFSYCFYFTFLGKTVFSRKIFTIFCNCLVCDVFLAFKFKKYFEICQNGLPWAWLSPSRTSQGIERLPLQHWSRQGLLNAPHLPVAIQTSIPSHDISV